MQPLAEVANRIFEQQAEYAQSRYRSANELWTTNDPMQQKQITEIDRRWARFCVDHGLLEVLPEWSYRQALTGAQMLNVVRCPVCLKPRPSANVYLCPHDRAPYNACEAFMAGMPVPEQYLDLLQGEELEMVAREKVNREMRMKKAMADARNYAKSVGADETK